MSKKKKRPKSTKLDTEQSRDDGSPAEKEPIMSSDTAHFEGSSDPRTGTAAIPPVTEAMMDHAAHEAAALADGVAHGTVAPAETGGEAAASGVGTAEDTAPVVSEVVSPVVRAASEAAAAKGERASEAAQDSLSASADALSQYNAKIIEMVRTNMAASSAHLAALMQAKSIPEAVSLNAEHIRRQIETLTGQGRDLATLAQQAAFEAFRPLRDTMKRGR